MSRSSKVWLVFPLIDVAALLLSGTGLHAGAPRYCDLPKYVTPVPYAGMRNWHVTQNLGPTGARGWVYGHRGDSSESREILVKSVETGSPAEGILRPYDIIVGVGGGVAAERFSSDARLAFADAVTQAETRAGGGALNLLVWRDGEVGPQTVNIPVMGRYSPTAPFACEKSARIVTQAADALAYTMPPEGFSGMTGALNALFLLATGEDVYLDLVRRSACLMGPEHTVNDAGHETWRWGYCNLFLSEYYLATGDQRVLPTIQRYSEVLADGQCNPGTWGHKAVPDRTPPGYGSMNQSGLICFISLILARDCGVTVGDDAIRDSIRFYGSYAGKGAIPYGDHAPGTSPTGNGKNGSAAVAFYLLGADPAAQWFARLCASTPLKGFEGGHTGNFFNQIWSPLGAALSGKTNYSRFWSRFNSYRDMARRWDGSFVTQPFPDMREGDLGTGNYVRKGPNGSTGGFALSYLASSGRLAILGRRESVFGRDVPEALKPALARYEAKAFADAIEKVEPFCDSDDRRVRALARQLKTISQRNLASMELTISSMKLRQKLGDLYVVKAQLRAIESVLDREDPRLAQFRSAVDAGEDSRVFEDGRNFYRHTRSPQGFGLKAFMKWAPVGAVHGRHRGRLADIAKRGAAPYKAWAREWLDANPRLWPIDETAFVSADSLWCAKVANGETDREWLAAGVEEGASVAPLQTLAGDDPQGKPVLLKSVFEIESPDAFKALWLSWEMERAFDVYLNGTKIIEMAGGSGRLAISRGDVLLKSCTRERLRAGENVLVVEVSGADCSERSLGLKGLLHPY